MTKQKAIGFSLAGLGCIAVAYAIYHYRHHRHPLPEKTVEQIMRERADHAAGDLATPLGQAVLSKNWPQVDAQLKTLGRPHLQLANVIRALFIQNKLDTFKTPDLDALELKIMEWLESEPIKDELGFGVLANQLYRLPLLPESSASYQKLEELAHSSKGGAYHDSARLVFLGKLIMQAGPPSERTLKLFESDLGKTDPVQWTTFLDGVRHAPTQNRLIAYTIRNWKSLKPDGQVQALTAISNAIQVPNSKELVLFSLRTLKNENSPQGLIESSLRYLSALANKGELSADQKRKISDALANINKTQKSPFLTAKIEELTAKLKP